MHGGAGPAGNTGAARGVSVRTGSIQGRSAVAVHHEYEEARDRTGQAFKLIPHSKSEIKADLKLFREPGAFGCPSCGTLAEWKILYDRHPGDSNIIMLGCNRCDKWMRAMAVQIPQMDDTRAKQLGIWVPGTYQPTIEIEVDFDD